MTTRNIIRQLPVALAASLLLVSLAHAEKPDWAGKDKERGKPEKERVYKDERRDRDERYSRDDRRDRDERAYSSGGLSVSIHFGDRERLAIRDYYRADIDRRGCPPGLAKKGNGCLPPGQAKKWRIGSRLPAGIEIHDLPRDLSIRIGVPPKGYKYVRVASDILLIAVGTSMVVDAIENLGGLF